MDNNTVVHVAAKISI